MKKMTFKEVGMPTIILFVICLIVAAALAFTNLLTKDKIAENALETEIAARQAVLEGTEYELISENNGVCVYAVLVTQRPEGDASPSDTASYRVWSGLSTEPSASTASKSDISGSDLSGSDISGSDLSGSDISASDAVLSNTDIADGVKYHIGYVATSDARGFGGTVEIIVGIDLMQQITGVRILSHSETPGFGANCENPDWLAQFEGKSGTLAVTKDKGEIDSISGSTITSRAVTSAINKALTEVSAIEGRMNAQ